MGAWSVLSAAFLLALAVAAPAGTDCMNRCLAPSGCALDYESSRIGPRCSISKIECEAKCRDGGESGPSFGATAYSRSSGAVGWSYSLGLERAANAAALANCARRNCEVIVSFHNTCAPITVGAGVVGWAWAPSQRRAENGAKAECVMLGGKSCRVEAWACSLP